MDDRLIPLHHNTWATRIVLDACAKVSDEQFHRRFVMGCGSLHDTLVHIIGAMARWADRISERTLRPSPEAAGTSRTIDELRAMLDSAASELEEVANSIYSANRGGEMLEFPNPGGEPFRFRRATALAHVTTHGMHHRAQMLNMLRQIGVEPLPEIDVIDWELATEKI